MFLHVINVFITIYMKGFENNFKIKLV